MIYIHTIVIPLWSCQDKSIKPYVPRVNICGNFDFAPKYRINLTPHPNSVKKLIFSTKRLIRLMLLSSIVFKKSKLDHQNPLS